MRFLKPAVKAQACSAVPDSVAGLGADGSRGRQKNCVIPDSRQRVPYLSASDEVFLMKRAISNCPHLCLLPLIQRNRKRGRWEKPGGEKRERAESDKWTLLFSVLLHP